MLQAVVLRKRHGAELKMLMLSLGVTREDEIRNESIRGTAHVRCFED